MKFAKLTLLFCVVFAVVGCGSSETGDVESAAEAMKAAPKSEAELSTEMPDQAKRSAEAAIKQNNARNQQMDAQAEAMRKARNNGQ